MKKCVIKITTLGYEKIKKHTVTRISFKNDDNIIHKKVEKIKFGILSCNSANQKVSLSKILTA